MDLKSRLVAIATAAVMCGSAQAVIKADAATVGLGIGSYYFDSDVNVGNRPLYNAYFGYNHCENWGVEAMAGRFRTQQNGTNTRVNGSEWSLSALRHFNPKSDVVYFGLLGLGQQEMFGTGDLDRASRFAHLGAGVKYFFHNDWAVRMDGRYYRLRYERETATTNDHFNSHSFMVNFSVMNQIVTPKVKIHAEVPKETAKEVPAQKTKVAPKKAK